MQSRFALPTALLLATASALAQAAGELVVERKDGASMKVPLAAGIAVNSSSNLKRSSFRVVDPAGPVQLVNVEGVDVAFTQNRTLGEFHYTLTYTIEPKEPVVAIELRSLVFDVFGRHMITLQATEVADFGAPSGDTARWRIYSEADAKVAHQSITYVSRVRTAAGRVYTPNSAALIAAIRRAGVQINEGQLEARGERDRPGQ